MQRLRAGISPCPNDTFIFHALMHGVGGVELPGAEIDWLLADVEELNGRALAGELDMVKVSAASVPRFKGYALLRCGGAMGRGCGPLLVARAGTRGMGEKCLRRPEGVTPSGHPNRVDAQGPLRPRSGPCASALSRGSGRDHPPQQPEASFPQDSQGCQALAAGGRRIAVPGAGTSAVRLLDLHGGFPGERVELRYDRILQAVASGEVDAGLLIHESRFVYAEHGLELLADLGAWWEGSTGLPIPLGGIVARRSLGVELITGLEAAIQASLRHAWANPADSRDFIRRQAQELDDAVIDAHIRMFVNDYSLDWGADGREALRAFLGFGEELFI